MPYCNPPPRKCKVGSKYGGHHDHQFQPLPARSPPCRIPICRCEISCPLISLSLKCNSYVKRRSLEPLGIMKSSPMSSPNYPCLPMPSKTLSLLPSHLRSSNRNIDTRFDTLNPSSNRLTQHTLLLSSPLTSTCSYSGSRGPTRLFLLVISTLHHISRNGL